MIVKEKLSVRKVEELVKESKEAHKKVNYDSSGKEKKVNYLSFSQQKYKDDLTALLKAKVKMKLGNNGSGNLVIPFKSENDLERIMKLLDA